MSQSDETVPCGNCNGKIIDLDPLSLCVANFADLQATTDLFNARDIALGEIKPLETFSVNLLAFGDPDNIQAELIAPLG